MALLFAVAPPNIGMKLTGPRFARSPQLILVALGRWGGIAAAAGNPPCGCRVFHPDPVQAASRRTTSRAPFR